MLELTNLNDGASQIVLDRSGVIVDKRHLES